MYLKDLEKIIDYDIIIVLWFYGFRLWNECWKPTWWQKSLDEFLIMVKYVGDNNSTIIEL